jgi:ketosteroid isomerase-like protein
VNGRGLLNDIASAALAAQLTLNALGRSGFSHRRYRTLFRCQSTDVSSFAEEFEMTVRTISALLLFLSFVTTFAAAQSPRPDSVAQATIRALDNEERVAALNQDLAALERLWSEHFIVNAPSNQILPNRSAVLDWFRKGMTARSSYERVIEQIRVDRDIAVVMGEEILTPTANAPHAGQTVRRRFTNIWKKEGEVWRLWARHANWIPTPVEIKSN